MADRIGQQLGNYRILRELGRGGFADVYLGEHIYLKSFAALKILRMSLAEQNVARFLAEAQTLVHLRHPHIVRVLEFMIEQGSPILVMDYAPGGTARQLYPRGSRLPLATVIAHIKQLAAALQYAHSRNVIHRDVKPENLLLGEQRELLLSDFGLALLTPSPELLSTQEMAGTIAYMAPEQIRGKPCFASDQYALGIIAYEWLCGTHPFEGSTLQILYQHLEDPPPRLREKNGEVPEAVEAVLHQALAKDPQQRLVSIQAFAHALERASWPNHSTHDSQVSFSLQREGVPAITTRPHRPGSDSYLPVGVFLAAAPADEAFATRLKADLEARGVTVWNHRLGEKKHSSNPQEQLRLEIRAAHLIAVVLTPNLRSSRTVKEHLQIAAMYGRELLLIWEAGEEWKAFLPDEWEQRNVLDLVDARGTRYEQALDEIVSCLDAGTILIVPEQAEGTEPPGEAREPRNPYKGLRAFTGADAAEFFGRNRLIDVLVEDVAAMTTSELPMSQDKRLLTIIGPSGSGKSSVVMAGLLPRLQRGVIPGSEAWVYLEPMLPGKHPIEALGLILATQFPERSFVSIREDLEDDTTRGLHLLASQLVKQPGARVVLLVDQFEELFTQTDSEEERRSFIEMLLTATTEPRGPLLVVLTLRADFYGQPMQYPELHRLMQLHLRQVLPMEVEDLRATIEQPAALADVQLTFETNLVGDLLYEMRGQSGVLPLLQFTLAQLFERRDGHRLTLQAYREIGGVKGALSQHAEKTFTSLPSEGHRRLAQALFLRLIDPGLTEQDTTRRRASLSEFTLPDATQTHLLRETIDTFIAARLLTANEIGGITTIEVSHEALIREWPHLADWLREAREDIPLQQAISRDVVEWEGHDKPRDRLYRGTQLKEAQAWARRNLPSEQEVAFLRAGTTQRRRSLINVLLVVLLLLTTTAAAGWFLLHQSQPLRPLDPTRVTTLADNVPGSLRWAIENAPAGSTITFAPTLRGTIMLTGGDLQFVKNLTLRGPGANLLAISSSFNGYIIHVASEASVSMVGLAFKDSTVTENPFGFITNNGLLSLSNSTVSGNSVSSSSNTFGFGGGGIYNTGALTPTNSTVSGNTSGSNGGGIYTTGTLTLTNSTVSGNTAQGDGGGVYNTGALTLTNSTVSGNTSGGNSGCYGGGGIANSNGTAMLTNSAVSGNTTSGGYCGLGSSGGGGIANDAMSFLTLTNSTVSGNTVQGAVPSGGIQITYNGGGITNDSTSSVTLINSTVSGNTAQNDGGGIANFGGNVESTFCTIYGNKAAKGGGLADEKSTDYGGNLTKPNTHITNSIVAGNSSSSGPDIYGPFITGGYNLIQNLSGATVDDPDHKGSTDLLGVTIASLHIDSQLRDNDGSTQTLALLQGSPARDKIPLSVCSVDSITTDQRGKQRPDDHETACDIGAYESID